MLFEPVVIAFNAFEPTAVLLPPPVFAAKENEPIAESFANGLYKKQKKIIAEYYLSSGTFDVSIF